MLSVTLFTGIISHKAVSVISPVEPFAISVTNTSPFFQPPKVQPVFAASRRVMSSLYWYKLRYRKEVSALNGKHCIKNRF